MTAILVGSGVGGGTATGPAYVIGWHVDDAPSARVPTERLDDEIKKLDVALEASIKDLHHAKSVSPTSPHHELAAFIDAHILMVSDPSLRQATIEHIRANSSSAHAALLAYCEQVVDVFEQIEDPYLRAKKDDVNQIVRLISRHLPDGATQPASKPTKEQLEGRILVAHDLSPADLAKMKNFDVAGFVTDLGSPVSHVAILAHSMQIPAVVGLHGQISEIPHGSTIAIDSGTGEVAVAPTGPMLRKFGRRQKDFEQRQKQLASLVHLRPTTGDGHEATLLANVELPADIEQALVSGATGVGLYRTEFLFMNRESLPDECEQYDAYAFAAQTLDTVTIRTLDLGADKQVDGGREQGRVATNPALGIRAVRLCLQQMELFRPQLRAIYRASGHGKVQCMIPMLTSIEELDQVMLIMHEIRQELAREGHDFNPDMPIGAMIEVPAAAISAELFAKRLDFLSIGTNDLIQYTLAIDRIDDEVNYLYDPMNLSVLQLIKNTIDAADRNAAPVSMCGEMAGDPMYTRLLLGMGLRIFSINPAILPELKHLIRTSRVDQAQVAAGQILAEPDSRRRRALLDRLNRGSFAARTLDATA